jgi:hypothetical protein
MNGVVARAVKINLARHTLGCALQVLTSCSHYKSNMRCTSHQLASKATTSDPPISTPTR